MYERKVKGKQEFVFKSKEEFRKYFPNKNLEENWRTARNGSYTLTDDGQVVRILDRKKFNNKTNNYYVRTLLGLRRVNTNETLSGEPRKNIYSFSSDKTSEQSVRQRKNPTTKETLFARYVANGEDVVQSYLKVFKTNNVEVAKQQSRVLLKQERIISMISKENIESLDKIGINRDYLFEKTKEVIENLDGKDSDKLRAIELLMKIKDMFPKEEKREALTVFQGFSREQLQKLKEADEIKQIAHAENVLEESNE